MAKKPSTAYDRNRPYNDLPLLPPAEDRLLTKEVWQALNNANRALAELKGLAAKLPNQSMLVNTIALREAKASSEIENIFTTDDELYRALTGNEGSLKGGAKEVLRYREALWAGLEMMRKEGGFSQKLFIKLYQIIKQTNDGIRPPQTETVIRKQVSGSLERRVIYTPPRGKETLREKLNNLTDFLNDDKRYPYDPLIKMAAGHYQFEAIHPFRDGNGRTGRILNILLLIQKGLLDVPILYLSAYIIHHKDAYYENLSEVTALRRWDAWVIYMLRAVEETARYTINKVNEIDRLFVKTAALTAKKYPHIGKEIIEKIFEQPYTRPKTLMGPGLKSLNTAKRYMRQLESLGILTSKKIGKEQVYLNADLLQLLSET